MKTFTLICGLLFCVSICQAKNQQAEYQATNPDNNVREDAPIVITEIQPWVRSATVTVSGVEIPSQLDDLNGDGVFDELALVMNFKPRQTLKLMIQYSDQPQQIDRYKPRVHSQMFLKEGSKIVPKTQISSDTDNMYNKLHHHGPAFESELIAYRIYFDKKQTLDMYGKRNKGLEIAQTLWYPSKEQLEQGYGDDIIRVFESVGVGALKGWDAQKREATHITPVANRTATIVAKGAVRTIVEMAVKGWEYQGRKVDMRSRYTLFAGHRDLLVENSITTSDNNPQNLTFATGVMKMAKHTSYVNGRGEAAVWGEDYPVNDTVAFSKQTCGLAVTISPKYIKQQTNDTLNYLYVLTPDSTGNINYWLTVCAEKENFGYKNDRDFFGYVDRWAAEIDKPITIRKQ